MPLITYDSKSFFKGGERIWITAAEIHYFRFPRAEWEDVLLRAKRAGINTICTYIAWNFHEESDGVFDFSGDKDLGAYLDIIARLGLYAMVRPGPYICSEWDGGGLPGWLCAKGIARYREDDPVYMSYVTRWFDQLLPVFASRLASKGGPVITVQNENEYPGGWDASMRRYIEKLSALFRKHGLDVPILACNVHGMDNTRCKINDSVLPEDQILDSELLLTYNHHVVVEPLYDLKRQRPDAPMIVTEFWSGAPVYWGKPVPRDQDGLWPFWAAQGKAAFEFTSAGAQLCYYMFEGGTNFGFFGGCNIGTSYASAYPVGDGGELTEKYYALKPVILFSAQFGSFLADSEELPDGGGLTADAGLRLTARRGTEGQAVFVSASDGRQEAGLTLPGGRPLRVPLGTVPAAVLPVGFRVKPGVTADYANLSLLARTESALVLYGPAGAEGVVSINGVERRAAVRRSALAALEFEGVTILIADETMARRCWPLDEPGRLIFGPDFVGLPDGKGRYELYTGPQTPDCYTLSGDKLTLAARPPVQDLRQAVPPVLEDWRMTDCAALDDSGDGWTALSKPVSHEALGVPQGYVWYRAKWNSPKDGVYHLLLTNTPNRVSVFVNGRYAGTHAERRSVRMRDEYGHPADWAFEEIPVTVHAGENTFVFLSDNLGHNYDVPVPVGIQAPVYIGSRQETIRDMTPVPPAPVSEDAFRFLCNRHYRTPAPLPGLAFGIEDPERDMFVVTHGIQAWVQAGGKDVRPMLWPESPWTMFPQIKRWITFRLGAGQTRVCVRYVEAPYDAAENIMLFSAPASGLLTDWAWRPWTQEGRSDSRRAEVEAERAEGPAVLLPVGGYVARKCRRLASAWYTVRFPLPEGDCPVFFVPGELQKGQIYLNGHNAGRFWQSGGTQERYYLPRSWMRERDNELMIFEEWGAAPQKAGLVFGAAPGVRLWEEQDG